MEDPHRGTASATPCATASASSGTASPTTTGALKEIRSASAATHTTILSFTTNLALPTNAAFHDRDPTGRPSHRAVVGVDTKRSTTCAATKSS